MMSYIFAGIWPLIASYGLGTVAIIACLVAAWFSPVFKKEFVWLAVVIGVLMTAYSFGVSHGEQRVRAQCDAEKRVAIENAKQARAKAQRTLARKPSRWLPDNPARDPDCRDC